MEINQFFNNSRQTEDSNLLLCMNADEIVAIDQ